MNGILLVNKPQGMTSRDVVNIICKKFNTSKVGHTGTLDPIATGVLALAIGDGLKIVDLLVNDTKEYIATAKLGIATDTLDITGKIISQIKDFHVEKATLINVLLQFLGKKVQEVPLYSAIKIDGKRLYEYARENITVNLPTREIEILAIELIDLNDATFTFKVKVSKGTYIRSLINDIGKELGIPCTMCELIRTKQGNFNIENSHTLEAIQNDQYSLLSLKEALSEYPFVKVNHYIEEKIMNGRILENRYHDEKIVFLNTFDQVIAIYKVYDKDPSKIKPVKVFKKSDQ